MPEISIIVPCYNCYKFMDKCLESLENQTFKDFEVIFIDDWSQDNTYENLCKKLKETKLNYKLLKNSENLGAGLTRNVGIENATGKYITFIDSDDYIENNMFEKINNIFSENDVDCVIFDYYYKTINNNNLSQKTLGKVNEGIVNKSDALIYSTGTPWGKVYLLEKIKKDKIKFPNLTRNEDMVFTKLAISTCDKIYYSEQKLYHYIQRENSLVNNENLLDVENLINGFSMVEKKLQKKCPVEVEAMFTKEYFYSVIMTLVTIGKNNKEIKEKILYCEEKYPNIYNNETIQYMNRYQKLCIKAIKLKMIYILKILVKVKKIIQKIR